MTREAFEQLVEEALREIPRRFRREMQNVAIVVEDHPSPELLAEMEVEPRRHALRPLSGHAAP